jgi:hypothetical protein
MDLLRTSKGLRCTIGDGLSHAEAEFGGSDVSHCIVPRPRHRARISRLVVPHPRPMLPSKKVMESAPTTHSPVEAGTCLPGVDGEAERTRRARDN